MSGKFVRASKYRHVYGQAAKKESCYENLKITKNAWDSNIISSNGKYLSVNWDASGGGAFAVIPLNEVGKAPDQVPLFRGHKGPVLDTCFDPFHSDQVVSCSDDGKICVWKIPQDYSFHKYLDENDNIKDVTEPHQVLSGHTRKVGHVEFHPCAANVLASCAMDYTVKLWNLDTGKDEITLQHKDLVTSFAFNYNGSLLATTSRDKKLRIWDIRSGKVISEGDGHTGAKPSRVTWLGNTDRIVTTGFSRLSDRQVGIWDIKNIEKGPIGNFLVIDASSGVLIPFYDESNRILYLAGKGDGNIRYYEYENDDLHELSQYASTDAQRGFTAAPKHSVNLKENEILKAFKTVNDNSVEPISFIVPRRSELFQSDIYPDCPSGEPALTASDWFAGKDANGPLLMNLEAVYEGKEPSIKESEPATIVSDLKEEKKKEEQKKIEEKKASKPAAEPKKQPEPVKESSPPKGVDDVLKNSNKVNNLLDKVNDQSDDEDSKFGEDKDAEADADWEEVQKPKSESPKAAKSDLPKPQEVKQATPPAEKTEIKEVKSEEPKEIKTEKSEPKEVKAEKLESKEIKLDSKNEPDSKLSSPAKATAGAPTLKATVEKLAGIVSQLEGQIQSLNKLAEEKDQKLEALEKKIDQLLSK